jgi:hypothetical protein
VGFPGLVLLCGNPSVGPRTSRRRTDAATDSCSSEQWSLPDDYPPQLVRTALCIEVREGRLYCFMPPLPHIKHWLDLVHSLEDTAADTGLKIIIEGYEPPPDHRINKLAVMPDPGVIEVNVHPAYSWDELVRDTEILYEEARLTRLGTEKFMLDGRHTDTGGGNHVTLGGPNSLLGPVRATAPGPAASTAAVGPDAGEVVEPAAATGDAGATGEHLEREAADGEREQNQGKQQFGHGGDLRASAVRVAIAMVAMRRLSTALTRRSCRAECCRPPRPSPAACR